MLYRPSAWAALQSGYGGSADSVGHRLSRLGYREARRGNPE